jgi:hypothetical protein
MSSRFVAPAVLGVLAIGLVAYIVGNSDWEEVTVPAPLKGEAVTNPFYAPQKLVEALGATSEWRSSLGGLPASDGVVVLSHWHWDLIEGRRQQLEEWVNDGGRVVIDRTLIGGDEHLESWAGIRRTDHEITKEEIEAESAGDACKTLRAVGDNALETGGKTYTVCKLDGFSRLTADTNVSWELRDDHGLQAVRVRIGHGSVASINGEPFGNRDLLKEDHARLFVAAADLRRGDRVIFISEREHTSLLGLIWIYGAPVVVLFLIVLAALLWRGGARFGPLAAVADSARRSIAEQIRGTGQFTIRLGGGKALHAAAVRALEEAARRRLAGYAGSTRADRVEIIARATGLDHDTLADAINHTGPRRERELANTLALLETARRKIIDANA